MRRRKLEDLQPGWEEEAVAELPASYPDGDAYVLRSPPHPTLMPSILRFVCVRDSRGMRPVSRALDRCITAWLGEARLGEPSAGAEAAALMAAEICEGEALELALAGGIGDYRFTHYTGWRPDHTWYGQTEWQARLELNARTPHEYAQVLDDVAGWLVVAEPHGEYCSVLAACPEADVVSGRWWQLATGRSGAPMTTLELGSRPFADELFWLLGGKAIKAPSLRELDASKSHFFAIDGGPAGFVRFAGPDAVGSSSGFLDSVGAGYLDYQRAELEGEKWGDLETVFPRVRELVPAMRRFYDRAWNSDYWVVHLGYVDTLPELPLECEFSPQGE